MNIKTKFYLIIGALFSIIFFSCKKDNTINTPVLSEFASPTFVGIYSVADDPNSVYKIPVGITTVSDKPRTITFSVSSPTGAVEGKQYNLGTTTIVIPAGTAQDSISLKGIFSGYPAGRKDTLVFKIVGGDIPTLAGSDVYKVVLKQFCPLDMSIFSGDFEVVEDGWADYSAGDVVQLSVSGNTVSFDYPTIYMHQPLLIKVNPSTFATSVIATAFGGYSTGGTVYSCESVPGANSVVVPCDETISVVLDFYDGAGNDYGNNLLKLRKK
ncbi:MAG: hypothetical protein ABI091_30105 [Ferruginibacter sp.]